MMEEDFRLDVCEFAAAMAVEDEDDPRQYELLEAICEKYGVDEESVVSSALQILCNCE